jgi:hypothetical protein
MRVLKYMLGVACVASVIAVFRPIMRPSGTLGISLSIIDAAVFGAALYGIQKRIPLMWKLGFAGIVMGAASFLVHSLGVVRSVPTRPTVAHFQLGFLAIATVVVTGYWLLWWKRQKPYFINGSE